MDDFDNLFDEALSGADDVIISIMGKLVYVQIGGVWGVSPIRAVFDDPDATVSLRNSAGQIEDVAPTLFVKTVLIAGLEKRDRVQIGGAMYWVVGIDPDDTGSSVITLARGEPGTMSPVVSGWSKKR